MSGWGCNAGPTIICYDVSLYCTTCEYTHALARTHMMPHRHHMIGIDALAGRITRSSKLERQNDSGELYMYRYHNLLF